MRWERTTHRRQHWLQTRREVLLNVSAYERSPPMIPPSPYNGDTSPAKLLRSGHILNPSPVIGGGAPSYGAEGESRTRDASASDVGTSCISFEAFPLHPLRGHLPRKTGEE